MLSRPNWRPQKRRNKRKSGADGLPTLPLCFHWIGSYANNIALNDGSIYTSKAVKPFQSCELDYHHFINRDGTNVSCCICGLRSFASDGKTSNMISHIKREHPDHLPYDDMPEHYKQESKEHGMKFKYQRF